MSETKIIKRLKVSNLWIVEEGNGANPEHSLHLETESGELFRVGYEETIMPSGTYVSKFEATATHKSCLFFDLDCGLCRCELSRNFDEKVGGNLPSCETYRDRFCQEV